MHELLRAAAEASKPTLDTKRRAYLGCIAVRSDGAIVASRNGSSTAVCPGVHAERRASRKAGFGAVYYVARVKKNGEFAMAKPCQACMTYLRNRGAKFVVYTVDKTNWRMVVP